MIRAAIVAAILAVVFVVLGVRAVRRALGQNGKCKSRSIGVALAMFGLVIATVYLGYVGENYHDLYDSYESPMMETIDLRNISSIVILLGVLGLMASVVVTFKAKLSVPRRLFAMTGLLAYVYLGMIVSRGAQLFPGHAPWGSGTKIMTNAEWFAYNFRQAAVIYAQQELVYGGTLAMLAVSVLAFAVVNWPRTQSKVKAAADRD